MPLILILLFSLMAQPQTPAPTAFTPREGAAPNPYRELRASLRGNSPDLEFPKIDASAEQQLNAFLGEASNNNPKARSEACQNFTSDYSNKSAALLKIDPKNLDDYFATACLQFDSPRAPHVDTALARESFLFRLDTRFADLVNSPFMKMAGKMNNALKRYDKTILAAVGVRFEDQFLVTQILSLFCIVLCLFALVRKKQE